MVKLPLQSGLPPRVRDMFRCAQVSATTLSSAPASEAMMRLMDEAIRKAQREMEATIERSFSYGTAFVRDGKPIPPEKVFVGDTIDGEAVWLDELPQLEWPDGH